jgi:hypothetical protein
MTEPNNHAEVKGSIAGQTFTFGTKDVITLLLILSGLVGGYLIYTNIMEAVRLIYTRQEQTLEALHAHRALLVEEVHTAQQRRAADLDVIQNMLRTHEFNRYQEPDKRLPLDLPPSLLPHAEPKH